MRMMMTVTIPVQEGNAALKNGTLQQAIGNFVQERNPEAAYFTTNEHGERSGILVFDLSDVSEIPSIGEPLMQAFNARITIRPVMNSEDLRKGLSSLERTAAALN